MFIKSRRRLTQIFPFLLPIRVMQRKICFYAGMRFDACRYSKDVTEHPLPYKLFETSCALYNSDTGFDNIYQENKVFNLQLAAKTLNGLLIKPNETFSFWKLVRHADKHIPYKEGLTVKNGKLVISPGGGLCQMSNLLFWAFLHSPLTIIERHPHKVKDFPTLRKDAPEGVDATVSEGWLDLKVKNETDATLQIRIDFDDSNIFGSIFSDRAMPYAYEIEGKDLIYFRTNGTIFERISICRSQISCVTHQKVSEHLLYENLCEIGYRLPEDTLVIEKGA